MEGSGSSRFISVVNLNHGDEGMIGQGCGVLYAKVGVFLVGPRVNAKRVKQN